MRIFSFWEPASALPAYLKLCIKTWEKFIPNSEINILNYSNIRKFIDIDFYGQELFSGKYSLPQISDAIRCMLLEKHGGLWLDCDTIILNKDFIKYFKSEAPITFFGNSLARTVCIGLINAPEHSDFMKFWMNGVKGKLDNFQKGKDFWAYLGNSIIYTYVKEHKNEIKVFDLVQEGVMPEKIGAPGTIPHPDLYIDYYFRKKFHLSDIKASFVMLHNSWTPKVFKEMKEADFLRYDCTLANILSEIHGISRVKDRIWQVSAPINKDNNIFRLIRADGSVQHNPVVPGLTVTFTGQNGLVELHEPLGRFDGSSIACGTGSKVIIKGTTKPHARHGLNINARAKNNSCTIGKDFGCWGVSICLLDEVNLSVEIGDDCIMAGAINIRPSDAHTVFDKRTKLPLNMGENIVIGNHVWIGSNVHIKKGSTIPDNCVVGSFSVVTHKFNEKNTVLSGVPAQVIRRNIDWDRRSADKYLDDFPGERERERENKFTSKAIL